MYFNFENYESKGGSKEHFLNSFTKNYDLENDTYERVQKGIENFNKENNTSFDLYDYLKFNSKKIKFKKKDPLQEQGKEDLNEDLAEQKEPLQDENLEENKSFKRKHDLSKESEILNDTSLLSDVKNSLKRGAETLSDVVGLDELVNFDSDIKSKADENIKDLIKQGASYEDLNELEKNYLANKESRENVRDATNIFSKEKSIKGLATLYGTNEEEKAKKAFAEMKSTQEALSKEKFEDLNEQEKELIDKERGAVESFFVNLRDDEYKQKSFDELKEKYEAKNFISKDVLRDLEFLKNIHQSKSVSSLILSADEKEKKDYENSVLNIALNAGFDDVLVDEKEGKMYFEKEGQKYLVNEGFFDNFTNTLLANTGSITGGLIGAAKGASSAKSPQSALAKSIAYSALGSGIGASADVLATNYLLDRKNRFDEMLHHALEESALSAVGDALVLGAKPLLKTAKDSIKDFGKILDYTPLVSTAKNFPTQNIKAAQDLVEKSVPTQTQKELDEFYKAYGGRSDLADSKALDALVDTFKAKFGEDSFISKNTQKLNDILNLNSLSAKQNALFEAIRADESGFLLPYIKEVASYDVRAFKNLKNILNLSTAKLESSLKNLNLNKGDIKNILDELESGTKDSYNEAMNEILAKTYDDRFKVVLGSEVRQIKDLNPKEILENIQNWDLSKEANANSKQRLVIANVDEKESELLQKEFSFKGKKPLVREIDTHAIIHTLKQHGDEVKEAKRGNIAVNLEDIANYKQFTKDYDLRLTQDNGKIIYAKQINGHYVVVEEVLSGQDKLRFFDMWKGKGKINKDVLLSRSVTPEATPSLNLDSVMTKAQNNYTKFRQELQEQGLLDEEAMKFLNYVENTIYNPKGVTFTQLNNALKNINSFYKQSTNPGFKEHIKNAVESFLREDIKKGINEIFKQDKNLYAKASKLYETSLAEYAQMKELLKASAYKKARNESTTQVKALDELIKYSKGQGKDGLNNLDFLRAKLDDKNVAILEMNLLNRLYEKSLANTDESLRVFDSTSFLNELSSLQNNAFKSKEANDFIELVKGFDKLFKNDAKIALELAPVTAKKEGSALATSAKGAVLQKVVKSGFDLVFRNLGQNVLFGAFKDSIQGAALRYHLKKALQKSDTISEFNTSFKDRLKKGQFNSKTRELSKDFLNDVENFSKNLDEKINFTMQESKEIPTKTEFKIDENLQTKLNLDTDVLKADLEKLKSTHPELFENKGAVARLINKIKENPTFFFDNNRLDMKLVGTYIKDNFAELGIVTQGKNTGDIGHILETSKAQQRIRSLQNRETKSPLAETATLDTLPYNKADGRNSDISLSKDKDNSSTKTAKRQEEVKEAVESTQELGNPLKEFGRNYPQYYHKPQEAIAKLLETKEGQVAGAFYKEGLGDIDLVWGDSTFGLAHILERRTQQWGEEKALRFISHLPEIIQESKIIQGRDGNIELLSPRSTIILAKKDDNHFMITAFRDSGNKNKLKELENSQTFHDESFTSKSDSERNGTDILSQNQQADSSTKEPSLSKAEAKKQEVLNRALTKKQEQLAKLEKQYQEAIAKENSRPIPPPNQSNTSRRAADRALSTRIRNLLSKIEDKKNEIILLDPNASKKEKYIAQRGQTYYNSMLRSYENFTKNKEVFLDKDIFKIDLLGRGVNSDPHKLREFRNFIEHNFNITPLKDFGTNYAEFYRDGQRGIAKILSEAKDYEARKAQGKLTQAELEQGSFKGQVAGAFYKEGLGDIDLVWGDSSFGLAHILERRGAEIGEQKAIELIRQIPQILQDSKIYKQTDNKIELITDKYTLVLGVRDDKKFVVSTLRDRRNPKKLETIQTRVADDFTSETLANKPLSQNQQVNSSTKEPLLSKAEIKKQEVLNKIKSKEHKEYLRLQTKLEENKELEAQAFKELEPIKQRFLAQTKAKEYYAQALEKLDISAFNAYQIKHELKPIFSRIKKARRGQEHYKERLFSYPLKRLEGKSLTFNEKEFPLYQSALTLKQSHSIDKNQKLIQERMATRKAIETHLDIKPIKDFGTNYAEYYKDGQGAIAKLLSEAKDYEARKAQGKLTQAELEQESFKGQVAGAFYKEGLGDIDLVWGKVTDAQNHKGYGLAHILDKHPDFDVHKIPEIIEKGEVINQNNIRYRIQQDDYVIGLSAEYKGEKRNFIITAFERSKDKGDTFTERPFTQTSDNAVKNLGKPNSSTNSIKLQANAHIGTGNTKKDFDLSNKDDMQELKAFFHTHSTDTQEAKELFNRVLEQAQHFKIKVNFTNDLPRGASGEYDKYYLVKILDDYHPEYKAQTLFHELIHSVTTNAIMLVNVRTHLDKTLLHPKQIEAVNTITTIYKDIKTKFPKFSAVSRNYGMKNEFEFIAELANPEFRDKLKKLNVFEKIVDAITKIVVYLKDSVRGYGKPTGNAYEKTKKALIDIIDNYDKDFLEKYINTYKKEGMSSQAHYNLKIESKFLNDKGEIDFKTLESEAVKLPEALKFSKFKESILQSSKAKPQSNNKVSYKTIIGDININLGYTYSHFFKNGNGKENRFNLTGALTQILDNPLFVTKDKKGAYYFYKPFKDEKGFKHLVSISVDKNGKIEYRTSYEASNTRLKQMIKIHELVYLKD